MPEEERLYADARPTNILRSSVPRTDKVAQSLVQRVRNPDIGKLTSTMKASKGGRIPSIVLGPLTWLARYEGRRTDATNMPSAVNCL